jgi:hypothetical protein
MLTVFLVLSLGLSSIAFGQTALIVHDGTAGIEADVLGNLTAKLVAHGYTVTPNVGVPAGPLVYGQVWDIQFNNTTPLTPGDITTYTTYLAGGGHLFVMGENVGFNTRNNTIVSLIAAAGGGTIAITTPSNTVTINPPFDAPNAITNPFTFNAAAGTHSAGPFGAIATDISGNCPAIAYGPGSMTAALTGSMIVIFDVNFMQAGADANSQALTNNLISYLAAPTVVGPYSATVPTLSTWAMIVLAMGLMFVAFLRLRRSPKSAVGPF